MRTISLALIAIATLLAGCDDARATVRNVLTHAGRLLSGEGAGSGPVAQRGCPDVQGRYSLSAGPVAGGQFDLLGTYLGHGIHSDPGAPWRSISIEGDAARELRLTAVRRDPREKVPTPLSSQPAYIRYALETPYNVALDKRTITLRAGEHYECERGWIIPTRGQPGAHFRRDANGDLEGRLEERTARVISLWAETGAGIPYWFDSKTRWARWASVRASDAEMVAEGGSAPSQTPPRPAGGIARQEWDLTYGTGKLPQVTAATPPSRPFDPQRDIRQRIDRNAEVENIRSEGDRYVISLRVQSRGAVMRTIESLRGDPAVQDVQDHGVVSGGNRPDLATLSVRLRSAR